MKGTYTLLIRLREPLQIEVGSLGETSFEPGFYAYTGSALGPGGVESRVSRHREVSEGDSDTRHWHVDYLLGLDESSIEQVYTLGGDAECEVAGKVPGERISGFGSTDCSCDSHLSCSGDRKLLSSALDYLYR
ncbi:MAG: DUF123 domain-containing protein [Candidatus Nanohaloarchaea archaeon]